jgi:hypothetical protein
VGLFVRFESVDAVRRVFRTRTVINSLGWIGRGHLGVFGFRRSSF